MIEVLSPAGDMECFYRAIESGADAIYMGAPKFNARMRASNFTLEEMAEAIRYAHLKGVKIYVTLNTLVTTGEMKDVVGIVGELLSIGVDAFIVQDLGIVYVLKSVYPDIVIHGSTQMAVHNYKGAKVAKEMGLSRVVLSREATLEDIAEIKEKVDIELEVFVQGAMCVAFSGNCYLSSIKCQASGNRGECKQLCRLPYTASIGGKETSGYLLSPRDNCNVKYMYDLISLGVVSFKIEGRLRRPGYVAVATSVYRDIVDGYFEAKDIDVDFCENTLKKVFTRGEYTRGYIEGNDIIEPRVNNHIGEEIGRVVGSSKFKDINKIIISLNKGKKISPQDGIKFLVDGDYVSMGVGNVENVGKNIAVFGKNYIPSGSIVYKALDYEFESKVIDKSKYRDLHLEVYATQGNRLQVIAMCDGVRNIFYGDTLEPAKTKAVTSDNIVAQFSKVDKKIWRVSFDDITLDDVFIPLASLNEVRREIIAYYEGVFAPNIIVNRGDSPKVKYFSAKCGALAIISDKKDIAKLAGKYDRLIFAPKVYSVAIVDEYIREYAKYFDGKPILKLPIIAMHDDLKIIDDIVLSHISDMTIMIENIYGLDYLSTGIEIIAGSNLNIANDYSSTLLIDMGVGECVSSVEKWCPTLQGTYKVTNANLVLMTLAHCPYKTIEHSTCDNCKFKGDIALTGGGHKFTIRRYRVAKCYYELVDNTVSKSSGNNEVVDLRNV